VQRLFSMFPRGGPGFALLLLRSSVAAILLVSMAGRPDLPSLHLLFAGAVLVSIALAIGIFTPVVSSIVCVYAIADLLIGLRFDWLVVSLVLNSIALALLGVLRRVAGSARTSSICEFSFFGAWRTRF
jgi:hypothetical protein